MGFEPLFQLIVEIIKTLWPFRIVEQWERGVYVRFSRPARKMWRDNLVLKPGIYIVLPFWADVMTISVVDDPIVLTKQDFTLDDGTPVIVQAGAMLRVTDPMKALFEIEDYEQNATELTEAAVGKQLVTADKSVFDTGQRRSGLLRRIASDADSRTAHYGVQIREVWFTSFSLALMTGRIVTG